MLILHSQFSNPKKGQQSTKMCISSCHQAIFLHYYCNVFLIDVKRNNTAQKGSVSARRCQDAVIPSNSCLPMMLFCECVSF